MKDKDAHLMMEALKEAQWGAGGPEDNSFKRTANPVSVAKWITGTVLQGFSDDTARNNFYTKLQTYVNDAGSGVHPVDPNEIIKHIEYPQQQQGGIPTKRPIDYANYGANFKELEAAVAYIQKFVQAGPEAGATPAADDRERERQQYGGFGEY